MRRHPDVSLRTPQSLGYERAILSKETIGEWFARLEENLKENGAADIVEQPSRIYNCDESGFQLAGKHQKVLAMTGQKNVCQLANGDKTQITVMATIGADGSYLPPMIIFPGVKLAKS